MSSLAQDYTAPPTVADFIALPARYVPASGGVLAWCIEKRDAKWARFAGALLDAGAADPMEGSVAGRLSAALQTENTPLRLPPHRMALWALVRNGCVLTARDRLLTAYTKLLKQLCSAKLMAAYEPTLIVDCVVFAMLASGSLAPEVVSLMLAAALRTGIVTSSMNVSMAYAMLYSSLVSPPQFKKHATKYIMDDAGSGYAVENLMVESAGPLPLLHACLITDAVSVDVFHMLLSTARPARFAVEELRECLTLARHAATPVAMGKLVCVARHAVFTELTAQNLYSIMDEAGQGSWHADVLELDGGFRYCRGQLYPAEEVLPRQKLPTELRPVTPELGPVRELVLPEYTERWSIKSNTLHGTVYPAVVVRVRLDDAETHEHAIMALHGRTIARSTVRVILEDEDEDDRDDFVEPVKWRPVTEIVSRSFPSLELGSLATCLVYDFQRRTAVTLLLHAVVNVGFPDKSGVFIADVTADYAWMDEGSHVALVTPVVREAGEFDVPGSTYEMVRTASRMWCGVSQYDTDACRVWVRFPTPFAGFRVMSSKVLTKELLLAEGLFMNGDASEDFLYDCSTTTMPKMLSDDVVIWTDGTPDKFHTEVLQDLISPVQLLLVRNAKGDAITLEWSSRQLLQVMDKNRLFTMLRFPRVRSGAWNPYTQGLKGSRAVYLDVSAYPVQQRMGVNSFMMVNTQDFLMHSKPKFFPRSKNSTVNHCVRFAQVQRSSTCATASELNMILLTDELRGFALDQVHTLGGHNWFRQFRPSVGFVTNAYLRRKVLLWHIWHICCCLPYVSLNMGASLDMDGGSDDGEGPGAKAGGAAGDRQQCVHDAEVPVPEELAISLHGVCLHLGHSSWLDKGLLGILGVPPEHYVKKSIRVGEGRKVAVEKIDATCGILKYNSGDSSHAVAAVLCEDQPLIVDSNGDVVEVDWTTPSQLIGKIGDDASAELYLEYIKLVSDYGKYRGVTCAHQGK